MWALAAAFYLVAIFHRMSLGVASIDAAERFGVTTSTIAVLSTVQLGMYLVCQIPAGLLADRIGPRRSLTLGLMVMGLGEFLFAVSPSIELATLGRALIGAGDACMFLNVLRVAAHWLPDRHYALAAALTAACGAFGQLLSTAPLSAALSGIGWTPTFAASGILTAALALFAVSRIQDRPDAPEPTADTGLAGRIRTVAPVHPPMMPALKRAWRSPGTRHGLWVHFTLNAPFVTLTGLWAYPYLVEGQGIAPATAATMLAGSVIVFGVSAPLLGMLVGAPPAPAGRALQRRRAHDGDRAGGAARLAGRPPAARPDRRGARRRGVRRRRQHARVRPRPRGRRERFEHGQHRRIRGRDHRPGGDRNPRLGPPRLPPRTHAAARAGRMGSGPNGPPR